MLEIGQPTLNPFNDPLSLVLTSHVSDVSGIVNGIRMARTLRSSGNQADSERRKQKRNLKKKGNLLILPIPIPIPIPITVEREAPYTSDSDSDSDCVTSGKQALR